MLRATFMSFKRRDFLKSAAVATAAGTLAACGPGEAMIDGESDELSNEFAELNAIARDEAKFPQGVWAGSVTADTVILTTRYTGNGAAPRLRVWTADAPHTLVFDGLPRTENYQQGRYFRFVSKDDPSSPGFLKLEPNTAYAYRFYERGNGPNARVDGSRRGHFKTLAKAGTRPIVRWAGGSCNLAFNTPFPVLQDVGNEENLNFFIHMGDSIYADKANNPNELEEYNAVYSQYWDNPGFKRLHAAAAFMSTWDDHEFRNDRNADDYNSPSGRAARKAWFLNHGVQHHENDDERIWRSFKHGDTAEFFLLDLRSERRPGRNEIMSDKQMNWLKQGLADSTAIFKIIVAPQPITDRPGDGAGWGWTPQREELLRKIENLQSQGKRGFFFMGGDIHLGMVAGVGRPGTPFGDIREFIIGPLGNPGNGMDMAKRRIYPGATGAGKQLHFTTGHNNAAIFTARPPSGNRGAELDVEYVVAAGNVDNEGNLARREVRYRATYAPNGNRLSVAIADSDTVIR